MKNKMVQLRVNRRQNRMVEIFLPKEVGKWKKEKKQKGEK